MSSRSLFTITVIIGAALTGAGIAMLTRLPHSIQPLMQPAQQIAQIAQPVAPSAPPSLIPAPTAAAPVAAETLEATPLRSQIRRAIQERNLTLLKSSIRAGVLREMLRNPEGSEQVNFENLDASAWKILEKAIDYRCRHLAQIAPASAAQTCFD